MSEACHNGRIDVIRSKLFVPADRPALFPKALSSAADAICFDLEDSVLAAHKSEARRHLREFLASDLHARKVILVRVNNVRSAEFAEDLSAAVLPSVAMLALPKVEESSEIKEAVAALLALETKRNFKNPIAILAAIESARGLRLAASIAMADERVVGLQLGLADLFEALGIQQGDGAAARQVRFQLRLAAGEAGLSCFDSAFVNFKDEQGFVREAQIARSLGFAGKSCIHPSQIALANEIFSPSPEEIAAAMRCVEAARTAETGGKGAFVLDGRMVDAPFIRRAESILDLAEKIDALERAREEG
jgi:citrate lyase subunit beta / citryl-CoA lyase